MIELETCQALPNSTEHNCFGCSPVNDSGLQMKFYADRQAVYSDVTVPEHLCGWSNIVHGGVLSTILDEIMSWAALVFLKRIPMTKSMNMEFIKPVLIQTPVRAVGRVRVAEGKHEAVMEGGLYDSQGDPRVRSTADFAVFSPHVARRLGIADEASLKFFQDVFALQ